MSASIKEQIIGAALQDPFLTVEQLAQKVGTTAPYVRTVLSEADLSLNKLRKDYARQLQYRLGERQVQEKFSVQRELQVGRLPESAWERFPQLDHFELFLVEVMGENMGHPVYMQLITGLPLTINKKYENLRELLPQEVKLEVKEQRVEVVFGPQKLTQAMGLPEGSHILKLTTYLHSSTRGEAVEILWLPMNGLALEFLPENGELKIALTG